MPNVDCSVGIKLGCRAYCCLLLVRLEPDERKERSEFGLLKGYVDKDDQGLCVNFDPETKSCRIWKDRPKVCREFDCNNDPMLQTALRDKFDNIVELSKLSADCKIPKCDYIKIPYLNDSD